jgi:hypothetical protein
MDNNSVIKVIDFLNIPSFLDEKNKTVTRQLRKIALEIMDPSFVKLLKHYEHHNSKTLSVHGRFGDLLTGQFSQYVPSDKYVDTLTYRNFFEKYNLENNCTFLTDSKSVLEGLERICGKNLQKQNSLPTNNLDNLWLDLFTLASSKTIIANYGSGFSVFAAMIKGDPLKIIDSPAKAILKYDLNDHYSQFDSDIRKELQSRDLINFLQKNFQSVKESRIFELIEIAYKSDSNYVMASCCYGIYQYLIGNKALSQQILNNAEDQSRKVFSVHPDPIILTLLVKYCLNSIESTKDMNLTLNELINLVPFQIPSAKLSSFLSSWYQELSLIPYKRISRISQSISKSKETIQNFIKERTGYSLNSTNLIVENIDLDLIFFLLSLAKIR